MKLEEQFGDWYPLLEDYIKSKEFSELGKFIKSRRKAFNVKVYPKQEDIFRAFKECPLKDLKVVILGNHPYINDNATGIAYGHDKSENMPGSNYVISRHIEKSVYNGLNLMFDHSMIETSNQGVLWLNTQLTVEKGSNSHFAEWRGFTDYVLSQIAENTSGLVYVFMEEETKNYIPILNKHKVNFLIDPNKQETFGETFNVVNNTLIEVAKGLGNKPKDYIIKW